MGLEQRQHCASAEPWAEVEVPSNTDPEREYRILSPYPEDPAEELICECEGFKHRGHCSHQELAFAKLCRWTERDGPEEQTASQKRDFICPRCGGETIRTTEWI